ncbi:putative transposase [Escherichia coli P0299438.2]|nr:putative transposase [Escherichia coli P0299438.2]
MWYRSLAGWCNPALLMLPRFADIFLQGNRWLKSSRKAQYVRW